MNTTLGNEECGHLWDHVSKGQSPCSQRSEPLLLLTVPRTAQSPPGDLRHDELLVSFMAEVSETMSKFVLLPQILSLKPQI
ncbi:hypothetical protein MDA_GLEAN10011449 [Myotis davidii]|uniref:Uncharacterized protein n=1 Tax=Myotis davidii TaxID=225400 RepID=L5LV93_MYODS|nr:hypothetical protein MDA_GLEAN10011449 [Myotis davidii]